MHGFWRRAERISTKHEKMDSVMIFIAIVIYAFDGLIYHLAWRLNPARPSCLEVWRVTVEGLVRWATIVVKGRPIHPPKPSLFILQYSTLPRLNGKIFRSRPDIRVDVSPKSRFQFMGTQGEYFSDSCHEETHFS